MAECGWCRVEELAPGVYAVIDTDGGWFRSNSGLIDMGDYTLVIDTQYNARRARDLAAVRQKLGLPEKCITVNTHHHGDHAWGNHVLGCPSIMHAKAADMVLALQHLAPDIYKPFFPRLDFTGAKYTLPHVIFEDNLVLQGDGRKAHLRYYGPAHTVGDIIVELPSEKILFAGDLVFNQVVPLALDGTVKGWIVVLELLMQKYGGYKIVGGHGLIADSGVLDVLRKYLRHLLEGTRFLIGEGLRDPVKAAYELTNGPITGWREQGRLILNIARAIMDLEGRPPGEPVQDLPRLATAMIEYEASIGRGAEG